MTKQELFEIIDILEGPNHHGRNELLLRNGYFGTCVNCPGFFPEECKYSDRGDHQLKAKPETMKVIEMYKKGNSKMRRVA